MCDCDCLRRGRFDGSARLPRRSRGALGRFARLALLLSTGGVGGDLFGALFFTGLCLLQNGDTLFTLGGGEAFSGIVAERAFRGAAGGVGGGAGGGGR